MEVPNVSRKEYNVVDITEERYLHLMDDGGDIREDLHCNHSDATRQLFDDIQKKFENGDDLMVTVISALGREMPLAIKNLAK
jgi:translation initiation factor 5A